MMDMGCHGVEYARWVLGRPKAKSVYAHYGHLRLEGAHAGRG